jgi:hypothetical protein
VALNTWWDGDERQQYWMEVATTGSLGEILIAPKFQGAAWSYDLVAEVRPGDRILHWRSGGTGRGLVGWSVATGEPEVVPAYIWQPRGTSGRALPGPRTTEGWIVTLGGLNLFDSPLMADELQHFIQPVLSVAAALEVEYGKPTYFPFYLYGGRELRAQQGYLMKFPVELVDVLPKVRAVRTRAGRAGIEVLAEGGIGRNRAVPKGTVTRVQDPRLRSAIENHAVDRAIEHYRSLGGTDFVKLGKPYDVKLMLAGVERHVEVKGSSLLIETVELTSNEVLHATEHQPTDLVVVDDIDWARLDGGEFATSGGRLRIFSDWTPIEDHLVARKFAYTLPATDQSPDDG